MKNVYVILVEPVYKGNVGAIARMMHNFECQNLRIVGSIPQKEDYYLAVHSEDILQKALIFDNLENAIADLDKTIALSRRKGSKKKTDLISTELSSYTKNLSDLRIGLVFGRETFGLTDSEAELCDLRCYIEANKDFPSLNLAQAATVILYEMYKNYNMIDDETLLKKFEKLQLPANKEILDDSISYAIDILESIDCLKDDEDKQNINTILKDLLYKSNATYQMTYDFKKLFNRIHLSFYGKGKGFKQNEIK